MKTRRLSIVFLGLLAVACPRAQEGSRIRPAGSFEPRVGVAELTRSGSECRAHFVGPTITLKPGVHGFVIAAHNSCRDDRIAIKALARYPLKNDGTPDHDRPQEFSVAKAFDCVGDTGATVEVPFPLAKDELKTIYCRARDRYESEPEVLRASFKFCAAVGSAPCSTAHDFDHEIEIIVLP